MFSASNVANQRGDLLGVERQTKPWMICKSSTDLICHPAISLEPPDYRQFYTI
jgi:hypothetical protein